MHTDRHAFLREERNLKHGNPHAKAAETAKKEDRGTKAATANMDLVSAL